MISRNSRFKNWYTRTTRLWLCSKLVSTTNAIWWKSLGMFCWAPKNGNKWVGEEMKWNIGITWKLVFQLIHFNGEIELLKAHSSRKGTSSLSLDWWNKDKDNSCFRRWKDFVTCELSRGKKRSLDCVASKIYPIFGQLHEQLEFSPRSCQSQWYF